MTEVRAARWKLLLAFAIVYVVWGSTYLAIWYAVKTIPPLLMAGSRFLVAGAILFTVSLYRTRARPTLSPTGARRSWWASCFCSAATAGYP
jgi:drug/metabolite transporter (DMT)-like permease